jgi:hypothetical protein
MKENVGEVDRNFRFIAGGALLAMAFGSRLRAPWRIAALVLGASELITATTRYCPMNAFIGVDTNRELVSQPLDAHQTQTDTPSSNVAFSG